MGVTYIVVNSSKQQWFQPDTFDVGENTKWGGILRGLSGHALAHLLAPQHQLRFHLEPWIGDDVFLAGDTYEMTNSIPQLEPFQRDNENPWEIVTRAFSDISLNLLAELSVRHLDEFIESARDSSRMFLNLSNAMLGLDAPWIKRAIEQEFGINWRRRYNVALKERPWNPPQPMIPTD